MVERLRRWVRHSKLGFVTWRTLVHYREDSVSIRSGMLAYFVFFSLFPLLLLILSITSYYIDPLEVQSAVFRLLSDFPPTVRHLVVQNVLTAYESRGAGTLIGLGALAYSSSHVFFALDYALNAIWESRESRPWYELYGQAALVIVGSLVLIPAIIALDTVSQSFGTVLSPWLSDRYFQDLVSSVAFTLSMLGSFALFLAVYRWVPSRKVGWRCLWPGALVAVAAWKVSKVLFAWYLRTLSRSEAVYGTIGVIMSLLFWLYISAAIFLIGAEINRALFLWHERSRPENEAA